MRLLNKKQFVELMDEYPNGGIVFYEGDNEHINNALLVTDGEFGARYVIPQEGDIFDFDWNINEMKDSNKFMVMEHEDILSMIQTMTSGLNIDLKAWYED